MIHHVHGLSAMLHHLDRSPSRRYQAGPVVGGLWLGCPMAQGIVGGLGGGKQPQRVEHRVVFTCVYWDFQAQWHWTQV